MKFLVHIAIERKEAILDPQGKASEHALVSLGFDTIEKVRIGKFVGLLIHADNEKDASNIAAQAAEKLLSNPIMETFRILSVTVHEEFVEEAR